MTATYVARHPMTASRRLGDEMIVMAAGDARLFTLNEVGAAIWAAADGVTPLDQIVAREICDPFDVDPATALDDAAAFVAELVAHGVLVTSDAPVGAGEDAP